MEVPRAPGGRRGERQPVRRLVRPVVVQVGPAIAPLPLANLDPHGHTAAQRAFLVLGDHAVAVLVLVDPAPLARLKRLLLPVRGKHHGAGVPVEGRLDVVAVVAERRVGLEPDDRFPLVVDVLANPPGPLLLLAARACCPEREPGGAGRNGEAHDLFRRDQQDVAFLRTVAGGRRLRSRDAEHEQQPQASRKNGRGGSTHGEPPLVCRASSLTSRLH